MSSPLESLIQCGTKLWLDSVDPDLVEKNRALGATGATSNPIIISDLVKTGRFDQHLATLMANGEATDAEVAWALTDQIVSDAERVFAPVWQATNGNDGYVSFELDPLLEDPEADLPHVERVEQYVELGKRWSSEHRNRMIKVPATPAGLESLEPLANAGVPLNVTLIFSQQQYQQARDAIWRGAQHRHSLEHFKSVYSIFISRVDVYTEKHVPTLTAAAQGQVGIVNAKRMWTDNQSFWSGKDLPLDQEMVFASTGSKKPEDPAWKYVEALAGSDIQTNPPATNDAVQESGLQFSRTVDQLPPAEVLQDIDQKVEMQHLEDTLMSEGIAKFAAPQKALLDLIAQKRTQLAGS
ncbi:transaldolase family protein [Aeoliella sp.]|uniref:transaldolase family protein n=1 Tax=Aeoliella sp. TaxID=2795800 RepID=UPI003CCBDB44